jgi:uncharacterized membrane protein|tara:strand:+ start:1056 stop:1277 length:222 start_codon:yes stop_codon:yes gene_type:complete
LDSKKSRIRHLTKALTWRVLASVTTFTIAYFVLGDVKDATIVTVIEFFLKMVIYYAHERVWYKYGRLGRDDKN